MHPLQEKICFYNMRKLHYHTRFTYTVEPPLSEVLRTDHLWKIEILSLRRNTWVISYRVNKFLIEINQ